MSINPYDVFPKRNLPDDAEPWGRQVEEDVVDLEHAFLAQSLGLKSENRTAASVTGELARQLAVLDRQADELDALYLAIPKTSQSVGQAAGFGLGSGWNTVVSLDVTVPVGATRVALVAIGSGQLATSTTTRTVTNRNRLSIANIGASPNFDGVYTATSAGWRSLLAPSYGWNLPVMPGQTLRVQFEVLADDHLAYLEHGSTYAVLTSLATFSG